MTRCWSRREKKTCNKAQQASKVKTERGARSLNARRWLAPLPIKNKTSVCPLGFAGSNVLRSYSYTSMACNLCSSCGISSPICSVSVCTTVESMTTHASTAASPLSDDEMGSKLSCGA